MREAATVILVRERNNKLQIYLLKRSTKSGFMGGLYVFPGGVVDPEDKGLDIWAPYLDLQPEDMESWLGGNQLAKEDILGFAIASVRETLEEAGILLATAPNKTKQDFQELSTYRLQGELPKSWFKTKIIEGNWQLSLSHLGRWSHWITPKLMKKRFDTRFFIVPMPEDQTCQPDQRETKHGIWLSPQKALEQNLDAQTPLSPPTIVTLTQLLQFKKLEEIKQEIKNRSWGTPIFPRLVQSTNGPIILEPWDPEWAKEEEINVNSLPQKVLPPGSGFSRIWSDNGLWKPIGL